MTTASSGNVSYVESGFESFTVSAPDGTVVFGVRNSLHDHVLLKPDVGMQEQIFVVCDSETFNGQTYSFGTRYHYANGKLQFIDIGPGC